MKEESLQKLITAIRSKSELSTLNEDFIKEHLTLFLKKEPKIAKILEENTHAKSAVYKETVKCVRAKLRKVYGLYRRGKLSTALDKFWKELQTEKDNQKRKTIIKKLLETHFSTRERWPHYVLLYKQIFKITGKPEVILDLGCGLNPLSFSFME